jgi:hypothetical protein
MKVIDKQLLFINSDERESGGPADFSLSLPAHLLTCAPHQKMRMVLNDVVIPYTWYNVQESNRSFQVVVNGVTHDVHLTLGSYHAIQLRDELNTAEVLGQHGISVSFIETSSQFTFSMSDPVGVNLLVFGSQGAFRLLGFPKSSTHAFTAGSLSSVKAVSMMYTDALFLHCDLLNHHGGARHDHAERRLQLHDEGGGVRGRREDPDPPEQRHRGAAANARAAEPQRTKNPAN